MFSFGSYGFAAASRALRLGLGAAGVSIITICPRKAPYRPGRRNRTVPGSLIVWL